MAKTFIIKARALVFATFEVEAATTRQARLKAAAGDFKLRDYEMDTIRVEEIQTVTEQKEGN